MQFFDPSGYLNTVSTISVGTLVANLAKITVVGIGILGAVAVVDCVADYVATHLLPQDDDGAGCGAMPNRVTVQAQENAGLRGGAGRTVETTAFGPKEPGVGVRQVQQKLEELYVITMAANWFPANRLQRDLRTAIIHASEDLNRYPPFGYTVERGQVFSENFGRDGYRVDVENRHGHNLRFF